MEPIRRERNVLLGTFVFSLLLLATHLGEFWPFSIYPMFSKAGQPWTRAMLVERDLAELADAWSECIAGLADDEGPTCPWHDEPFHPEQADAIAISRLGVDPIDFANYVSKTREWSLEAAEAILAMTGTKPVPGRAWFVYKVKGRIDPTVEGRGAFRLHMEPTVVFTHDAVLIRPPSQHLSSL